MKQRQTYMKTPQATSCAASQRSRHGRHSHSSSPKAAMTLRELYSSNNFQRDCSLRPASLRRLGKRYPLGDQLAHFVGQALEVAPFVCNRAAPIADDRAMSGNNADGRNAQQLRQVGEKAANAAVDAPAHARRTADRRQTAWNSSRRRPSDRCRYAPAGQAFRVSIRPPRSSCISSSTSSVGGTIFTSSISASPSTLAKCLQVKFAPRRQRARQILVPDKNGSIPHERRVAEDVIGMNVRVDDIANRLWRHGADRSQQTRTFARAAAGIDHRNRVIADNEADIGGVALIGLVHHVDIADVNVDAGRDLETGNGVSARCCGCAWPIARRQRQDKNRRKDECPRNATPTAHVHQDGHTAHARETTRVSVRSASFSPLMVLAPDGSQVWNLLFAPECARARFKALQHTLRCKTAANHNLLMLEELPKLFLLLAS